MARPSGTFSSEALSAYLRSTKALLGSRFQTCKQIARQPHPVKSKLKVAYKRMALVCAQSNGLKWLQKCASVCVLGAWELAHQSRSTSNSTIRHQSLAASYRYRWRKPHPRPPAALHSPFYWCAPRRASSRGPRRPAPIPSPPPTHIVQPFRHSHPPLTSTISFLMVPSSPPSSTSVPPFQTTSLLPPPSLPELYFH